MVLQWLYWDLYQVQLSAILQSVQWQWSFLQVTVRYLKKKRFLKMTKVQEWFEWRSLYPVRVSDILQWLDWTNISSEHAQYIPNCNTARSNYFVMFNPKYIFNVFSGCSVTWWKTTVNTFLIIFPSLASKSRRRVFLANLTYFLFILYSEVTCIHFITYLHNTPHSRGN